MKFEFENGTFVGTAEWRGPGRVALEVEDPVQRTWFERYFASEDSFMDGAVECADMTMERRDASEAAFTRAAYRLAAYSYKVRQGEGRRRERHRARPGAA